MRTHRLRVRTLLLLMVLIPLVGMAGLAGTSGRRRWTERSSARSVSHQAALMEDIMAARAVAVDESVDSLSLAIAAENGVGPDVLTGLFGVDFSARLAESRVAVDADALLRTESTLVAPLRRVVHVRTAVDDGTSSSSAVNGRFDALVKAIDRLWVEARAGLETTITEGSIAGTLQKRIEVLDATYRAFLAGGVRIGFARDLATATGDATVRSLIVADTAMHTDMSEFRDELGPTAAPAYEALRTDIAIGRFEGVVQGIIDDALAGRPSPMATDFAAFGVAFSDSARWMHAATTLVAAASADLSASAAARASAEDAGFWRVVVSALVVTLTAMVAVALVARSFTRPLRRITTVVQSVRAGQLGLTAVSTKGPRELADTTIAINEMTMSLHEASHDVLTGLLNRRAALDAVARDLARAEREDGRVMAIFIDLDELKSINDTFGHHAGDEALRLGADAIRRASRDTDIVARLGGDEFLVAGLMHSSGEDVEALAARIRDEVGHTVLWLDDVPVTLKCSVGVAINDPRAAGVDALISAADTAMYLMKLAGRRAA